MKFFNEHPQAVKYLTLVIMKALIATGEYYSDPDRTCKVVDQTIEDSAEYVDDKGCVHDSSPEEVQNYLGSDTDVFNDENNGKHFCIITKLMSAGKEDGVYWYYGDDMYQKAQYPDQMFIESKFGSDIPDYCFFSDKELSGIGDGSFQRIDGILSGYHHIKAPEGSMYSSKTLPAFRVYSIESASFKKLAGKTAYEDQPRLKTKEKGVGIELEAVDFDERFTTLEMRIWNHSGQYIKMERLDVYSEA